MTKMRRWLLSTLSATALLSPALAVAESPCDPALVPEANPSIQYRQRLGDLRCEGFYRAKVASGAGDLEVVGLLQRPLQFDASGEVLRVSAAIADRRVRVRGQGIPVKLYYRLDAELEPGGVMDWPSRLLQDEGVAAEDIGLFGSLADREHWYVPVDVVGSDPLAKRAHLLLRASVDTTEILWRHAPATDEGCGKMTGWNELYAPTGFAGGEAIPVDLPQGDSRRLCLEVAARTRRDGDWLKRLVRIQR